MNPFVEDEHRRARDMAATAIDFELEPHEVDFLQDHLAGCAPCRRWVAGLHDDALDLTELSKRDAPPGVRVAVLQAAAAPRRGVRPLMLLAAALSLVVVLTGASLIGGQLLRTVQLPPTPTATADLEPSPTSLASEPPATAVPTVAGAPDAMWAPVPAQASFHDPYGVVEAVAGTDRLVAVGDGCAAALTACHVAIWTSDDRGQTWSRVPDGPLFAAGGYTPARRGELTDVVQGGPGFVAVGRTLEGGIRRAAIWTSVDGLAWSRVADDAMFRFGTIEAVISGPNGLVAVGSDIPANAARAAAWTSVDGRTWRRAADDGGATLDAGGPGTFTDGRIHGAMIDVVRFRGEYVAVGTVCAPAPLGGSCHGAVWQSPDGLAWTRSAAQLDGNPYSLAAGPGTIVAVGDDGSGRALRSWTSTDGSTWTERSPPGGFSGTLDAVVPWAGGYIAAAASDARTSEILASRDGLAWSQAAGASTLGTGVINGLEIDTASNAAIAVGWDGHTPAAAAWIGTPVDR